MKNKIIIFALAVVSALLIVGGFVYKNNFYKKDTVKTIENVQNEKAATSTEVSTEKISRMEDITSWYEAKIEYPKDNELIKTRIFDAYSDFAKETKILDYKNDKEAREGLALFEGMKYSFNADFTKSTSTIMVAGKELKTETYIYQIYTFSGGAHGSLDINPITIREDGVEVKNEEILPDTALKNIAKIAYSKVMKQRIEKLKGAGLSAADIKQIITDVSWTKEGTDPVRDNYSRVGLRGNNIVVYFGQYQVGSYAEGTYEVEIPRSEIK